MKSLSPFSWFSQPSAANEDPFTILRKEVDRVFEDAGSWPFASLTGKGSQIPRLNVSETDVAIDIEAELPGLEEKDIDVTLKDDRVTISGEHKIERDEEKKDYHLVERRLGRFSRSVALPFEPDADAVKAEFKNGVLHLHIAKPKEVRDRTVKIKIGK